MVFGVPVREGFLDLEPLNLDDQGFLPGTGTNQRCIRHKSAHAASKGASQPTAALATASEEAMFGGAGGNT